MARTWAEEYLEAHDAPAEGVECQGNYCDGTTVDVRIVYDPYDYGMFGYLNEVVLCATCYACRSQDV